MKNIFKKSNPVTDPKKAFWKFVLQTLISILTAILTALGASSCVHHLIL